MNISAASFRKLTATWFLLKLSYGFLFIVAGADKFFNFIVMWQQYVHPAILTTTSLDYETFKIVLAVVEIFLGLLVVSRWTRIGAYGMTLWLLSVAVNLLAGWNYLDIAARDVVLAVGALSLARLTEVKEA